MTNTLLLQYRVEAITAQLLELQQQISECADPHLVQWFRWEELQAACTSRCTPLSHCRDALRPAQSLRLYWACAAGQGAASSGRCIRALSGGSMWCVIVGGSYIIGIISYSVRSADLVCQSMELLQNRVCACAGHEAHLATSVRQLRHPCGRPAHGVLQPSCTAAGARGGPPGRSRWVAYITYVTYIHQDAAGGLQPCCSSPSRDSHMSRGRPCGGIALH